VHCALRIVAMMSWNGVEKSSAQCAFGYAAMSRS